MGKVDSQKPEKSDFRDMTPVHIREPQGAEYVQVVFLESARFYKLSRKNAKFDQIFGLLHEALVKKRALQVRSATPHGDVIEEVRAP